MWEMKRKVEVTVECLVSIHVAKLVPFDQMFYQS